MKNFIFISPNFPENYWKFCSELKHNGFNVLGIGDCAYNRLSAELKGSLTEYYKVSDLENYEEVYRAVAFFIFKYGKIAYLESNNEYWLERDACLRTEFNITTGFQSKDIKKIKFKSEMKKYYKKAGVRVARHCLVGNRAGCKRFIKKVGYPVIVKPDNGVGAVATYKLKNDKDLEDFLDTQPINYIMEEYVDGIVNSYDAIVDSDGNPVFESGLVETRPLVDTVNNNENSCYYYPAEPYADVCELGRKVLKAFGVKSRYVHFEFFRLLSDQPIGRKGELAALEVNMRPAGGCSTDMTNYAQSTDIYKIWADMIAFDKTNLQCGEKYYCGYAGRRKERSFTHTEQEIMDRYRDKLKSVEKIPEALSSTMADLAFIANFKNKEEMYEFFSYVTE